MHETRLVTALADAVGRAAADDAPRIVEVELLVGDLAPIDATGLASGLADLVRERWGATPRVVVGSNHGSDPLSVDVRLVGLTVDG